MKGFPSKFNDLVMKIVSGGKLGIQETYQNNFSETKRQQKTGTGTGHLVNRLVP